MENNNCLFVRLFKVKKNGVFLFGISFFVLEIFRFLYYANERSDDVIGRSTKMIIDFIFIVCYAHMKIFLLYMRNISFIFIVYIYYILN